jgi:hypothetical protein
MSFFLLFGFLKNWKKTIILLIPTMVFFILHSSFPNKQERFILPVIPLILVLSIVGWEEYAKNSAFWWRHRTALRTMWAWFWVVNTILLVPFSLYYSKKARVEAIYSLYGKPVSALFLAGGKDGVTQVPFFYGGKYPVPMVNLSNDQQLAEAKSQFATSPLRPDYMLFYGNDDFDQRLHRIEGTLGVKMVLEHRFDPSFLDYVFYRLNPTHNKNEAIFVFRALYQ